MCTRFDITKIFCETEYKQELEIKAAEPTMTEKEMILSNKKRVIRAEAKGRIRSIVKNYEDRGVEPALVKSLRL